MARLGPGLGVDVLCRRHVLFVAVLWATVAVSVARSPVLASPRVVDGALSAEEVSALRQYVGVLQRRVAEGDADATVNRWVTRQQLDDSGGLDGGIDGLVGRLWRRVVRHSVDEDVRASVAGAEWWIQWRREDAGMHWHVDRDEANYAKAESTKFRKDRVARVSKGRYDSDGVAPPLVSSVLYLSDDGKCTAALHQALQPAGTWPRLEPPEAQQATCVCPKMGRYLVFDGTSPHAVVPSPLSLSPRTGRIRYFDAGASDDFAPGVDEVGRHRLTFLVNYWDGKPVEGDSVGVAPLREPLRSLLRSAAQAHPLPPDQSRRGTTPAMQRLVVESPWPGSSDSNGDAGGRIVQGAELHVAAAALDEEGGFVEIVTMSVNPAPPQAIPFPRMGQGQVLRLEWAPHAVLPGASYAWMWVYVNATKLEENAQEVEL